MTYNFLILMWIREIFQKLFFQYRIPLNIIAKISGGFSLFSNFSILFLTKICSLVIIIFWNFVPRLWCSTTLFTNWCRSSLPGPYRKECYSQRYECIMLFILFIFFLFYFFIFFSVNVAYTLTKKIQSPSINLVVLGRKKIKKANKILHM